MAKKDKKEVKNSKDKTSFFKSFKAELKKVSWPTPKQLFNNTIAVLTIVLITTVIVFVLDFAFESINKYGIDKVKAVISNSTTDEVENESDTSDDISEEETNSTDSMTEVESDASDTTTDEDTSDSETSNSEE